jgi:hypothetical protein
MKLQLNLDYARLREFGGFMLRMSLPSASVLFGGFMLLGCLGDLEQWQSWDDDDLRFFLWMLVLGAVFAGLGVVEFRYWRDRLAAWWHAVPEPAE